MKKLLLLMLLIPVIAYASPCQEFEYDELNDMNQKSLEKEYCNVADQIKEKLVILQQVNIERCRKDMVSCSGVADKMKRVYKKRFNKDIPQCPKAETKAKNNHGYEPQSTLWKQISQQAAGY
jgi:hypothetical protein